MSVINRCEIKQHGYFSNSKCPVCSAKENTFIQTIRILIKLFSPRRNMLGE